MSEVPLYATPHHALIFAQQRTQLLEVYSASMRTAQLEPHRCVSNHTPPHWREWCSWVFCSKGSSPAIAQTKKNPYLAP